MDFFETDAIFAKLKPNASSTHLSEASKYNISQKHENFNVIQTNYFFYAKIEEENYFVCRKAFKDAKNEIIKASSKIPMVYSSFQLKLCVKEVPLQNYMHIL